MVIEVSEDFSYRSDHLPNPDRLFFDIIGAKPTTGRKISTTPVGDSIVRQIRVAETQPGTTRVVLDLEGDSAFTVTHLSSPERLMVEVRKPQAEENALASTKKVFEAPSAIHAKPEFVEQPRLEPPPALALNVPQLCPPSLRQIPREMAASIPPRPVRARPAEPNSAPVTIAASKPGLPRSTASAAVSDGGAPAPARRTAEGDRSLTRVLGLKLGRVVIDPGHGGHDVGTIGPTGLQEKDLVLDVARRLGALIEKRLGSEVVYTRADDTFVPLHQRTAIANDHKADLFLSIHANSSPATVVSGVETYYLNFTSSKSALEVAARENAGADRSIYDLKDLVQQIALKDKLDESREFATKVQSSLNTFASRNNPQAKDRGVRKAPFVVLIGAAMPSVLVEIGFVSNPRDESLMKKGDHRQKIAEALYKGVSQYASGLSHFQVASTKTE